MAWTAKTSNLNKVAVGERGEHLPPYLRNVIQRAEGSVKPTRIWLYGSRARGDARENSDFDLAFEITDNSQWSEFVTDVNDNPPSLHKYDLVNLDLSDQSLKEAINKEGLVIYECRQK